MMQALANQVCEKVESKQRTTYNEVADELVSEFGNVEGTGQNCIVHTVAPARITAQQPSCGLPRSLWMPCQPCSH